jgi:cholesterol transport system auxiliary component
MRQGLFLIPLILAGCSGNLLAPSGSPPQLYRLSAPTELTIDAPPGHWQLAIDEPTATQDLNTSRIAVAPANDQIDYYAGVMWIDRPPVMLQQLLLDSFDRSGRIAAAQRQTSGVRSDFVLVTDLRDFEIETFDGPAVHISVTARLVRTRDRSIVASRIFEARTPAGTGLDATIAAFDQALRGVLTQIAGWTVAQGDKNP